MRSLAFKYIMKNAVDNQTKRGVKKKQGWMTNEIFNMIDQRPKI